VARLHIRRYPDEVLKRKAEAVDSIDAGIRRLVDDMIETMYAAPGIGLAAPQVGVSKRIIVVDISSREEKHPLIVLINPEIQEADGLIECDEGCLSFPGYTATVERALRVIVHGLNKEGKPVEIEGADLLARALQHEIDHLEGILFVDRLSSIKREFYKKRYLKSLKDS
jgi:peptide deformylase